jgi:lipopolysaccharide transport system ATP-binding protein
LTVPIGRNHQIPQRAKPDTLRLMSRSVISVENLSKAYRIGLKEEIPDTITEAVLGWAKAPVRNWRRLRRLNTFESVVSSQSSVEENGHCHTNGQRTTDSGQIRIPHSELRTPHSDDTIWALRDVSFEVNEGEVVGIIGRNGAGKSTLLKILSRITEPTSGRAEIRGRVSSLLEVGTGFHPELTGRENIYMNGTILGMTKREIDRKFEEIVDFSGVEKFLDTPIKRYSSGMQVRLAFSVAAHLEPEILIVDEVLAVGDAEFQKKCITSMKTLKGRGGTVLVVTHNMGVVTTLCKTALRLHAGCLVSYGDAADEVQKHMASLATRSKDDIATRKNRIGNGSVRITDIVFENLAGHRLERAPVGETLRIGIDYHSELHMGIVEIYAWFANVHGTRVTMMSNRLSGDILRSIPSKGTLVCEVPKLSLTPGHYLLDITLVHNGDVADQLYVATEIDIEPGPFFPNGKTPVGDHGTHLTDHSWRALPRSVTK